MRTSPSTPPPAFSTGLAAGLALGTLLAVGACSDDQSGSKTEKRSEDKPARPDQEPKADRKPAPMADDKAGEKAAGSERATPKFSKGDRAMAGLIARDVPAYNKAQGDPVEGIFSLAQAFEGDEKLADKSAGKLHAIFATTKGEFDCELFEDGAPATVANFVGLARGTRPYLDSETKEWTTGKFYDGVLFHRVIEDFMVQTGDRTGTGRGGPGFFVPDEFDPKLRHNKPGILSMANRNRVDPATQKLRTDEQTGELIGNTGSSQFFITVRDTSQLDDRHTVFGRCDPKVPKAITKVEVRTNQALGEDHKPVEDVKIETITFERR